MKILESGLIYDFLNLLGVEIITSTGTMLAFLAAAALLCVCIVSTLVLIFKFLVYIRRG